MNGRSALELFLDTDPDDVGCGGALELLDVYAELLEAGGDMAALFYPQVAAHVRACGPCAEDLEGVLAAIRSFLPE
jgi:hypothetical protein